jgi:polysaccharide deacetylase family protein (PEP-CTERM system associated)
MTGSLPATSQATDPPFAAAGLRPSLILSFDVEEHNRIEAATAAGLTFSPELKGHYADRMEWITRQLLTRLAQTGTQATFYIVGEIARSHPRLVFDIAYAGHEIGAHSWDHRRVNRFDPRGFAEDLRITKDALEQASGFPVFGFRAPTFSITRDTAWALDVLAECGYAYDSSIYPVRHDRYGIPDAPRSPFLAIGPGGGTMLELPPVTYRMLGQNLPVAGGGYFRLFPLWVTKRSIQRLIATTTPPVAMMYFHPWEFDPRQPRLRLGRLSKWRTYVGVKKSFGKLDSLLNTFTFRRAIDVVTELHEMRASLPRFEIGEPATILAKRLSIGERVEIRS